MTASRAGAALARVAFLRWASLGCASLGCASLLAGCGTQTAKVAVTAPPPLPTESRVLAGTLVSLDTV